MRLVLEVTDARVNLQEYHKVWYLDTRQPSRLWMLNLHDRPRARTASPSRGPAAAEAEEQEEQEAFSELHAPRPPPAARVEGHHGAYAQPKNTYIFSPSTRSRDWDLPDAQAPSPKNTDSFSPSTRSPEDWDRPDAHDLGLTAQYAATEFESRQVDSILLYPDEPNFSTANSAHLYSEGPKREKENQIEAIVITSSPDDEAEFGHALTIMSSSHEEEQARRREAEFGHANVGVA
jgi:hypothetical protein